jgi:formylglycine-generating enzyme required for sulfatase activity
LVPLLFLSHSGADADAALALARRLEASPDARAHGLQVWIDKKDLVPGPRWKNQVQDALARSTAFAVYVGTNGVLNWVEDEVFVALDRAHRTPNYPVIPVLAASCAFDVVHGFLSQFQGVRDVESDPEAFALLVRGALGLDARAPIAAEAEPFQGLEAFDTPRAHVFFGRTREIQEVVDLLRIEHLVAIVGDSGAGKSSLAKAGVLARFRGGALAGATPTAPDETQWHVLETRPLNRPFENLAIAVLHAGRARGLDAKTCSELADLVRAKRPSSVSDAIRLSGPNEAKTLLLVDQFEELFTMGSSEDQDVFSETLDALANPRDDAIRVLLTIRSDYYNLCVAKARLRDRLDANERRARYRLRRMSSSSLRQCVVEPLRLAGIDASTCETMADVVLGDVGDAPSDLALLEMALQQAWVKRLQYSNDLLQAYLAIGRVEGALAAAADEVVERRLSAEETPRVESLFVRLVDLGDVGGATRRIATKNELDGGRWELAQKLASRECFRLVVVAGDTVEITHEAIVSSWPRYVEWLRNEPALNDLRADDKRLLDALIDDARRWVDASDEARPTMLVSGFDLDAYKHLQAQRPTWLSQQERDFIAASLKAREVDEQFRVDAAKALEAASKREMNAARQLKWRAQIVGVLAAVVAVAASVALTVALLQIRRNAFAEELLSLNLSESPRFRQLADLERRYPNVDWSSVSINPNVVNPLLFAEAGGTVDNANDPTPDRTLDVIERVHSVFLGSRPAFGAMAVAVEDVGRRNFTLRRRAAALRDRLRHEFVNVQNKTAVQPIVIPDTNDESLNRWIFIKGGRFQMGGADSGWGPRDVSVSDFSIQQHEVTNTEFRRFDPSHAFRPGEERYPVTDVSWYEAAAYAVWLDASLPTEAQWEFAARGTAGRMYPWGPDPPSPDRANLGSGGPQEVGLHPDGDTPEHVRDLVGNVWEWCRDWFADYEDLDKPVRDPLGPRTGETRVIRGGSYFLHDEDHVTAAYRLDRQPGFRDSFIGIRLVRSNF